MCDSEIKLLKGPLTDQGSFDIILRFSVPKNSKNVRGEKLAEQEIDIQPNDQESLPQTTDAVAVPEVRVMEPSEAKRILDIAWERYLQTVTAQGYEDPKNVPPAQFMHQHCVI